MKTVKDQKPKSDDKNIKDDADWKNKYLRALADYQNLERRVREQSLQERDFAAREVVLNFLPVIDDLIKAEEQIKNEGLKLIINKFDSVLKKENVERKTCLNQKYDESIMECISIVEGEKDNVVVAEVRPAYLQNGQVIRTAQVIVSKKKKEE